MWWHGTTTTTMRYSHQTKSFWKLGWRIFGGRFLNFMGGFKSHGDLIQIVSSAGLYNPGSSEINFAVPDSRVLRAFDPYNTGGERLPGMFRYYGDNWS